MDPAVSQARVDSVIRLMEQGYTKEEACNKSGFNRSWLYKYATPAQDAMIEEVYASRPKKPSKSLTHY